MEPSSTHKFHIRDTTPKLMMGVEAEGRWKGLRTLFVKAEPSLDFLAKAYLLHSPDHLYFGAGVLSPVSVAYVEAALMRLSPGRVTLELQAFQQVSEVLASTVLANTELNLVYTLVTQGTVPEINLDVLEGLSSSKLADKVQLKFCLGHSVFLAPLNSIEFNLFNGSYSGDFLVEEV